MKITALLLLFSLMAPAAALAQCINAGCVVGPDPVEKKYNACTGKACAAPKLVIVKKPHEICFTCDVPSWTRTTVDKYTPRTAVGSDRIQNGFF